MTPAARIGLFMITGLIILGVFIIKIEDIPVGERGDRLEVSARFPSVAGLDRKAAVRIAGVRVGKVEEITLDGSEALLHLSLDPHVRLHEGAWAQITSLGMLGDKYIEIIPGDPNAPLLPGGTVLGGQTTPSFDDVMRVATEIGEDVKEVTEALRGSIGGPQGEVAIEEIVANIRELTASLKVLIAENQANVNATTANFRDFSATLRDEMPKITEKLNTLADQLNDVVGENKEDLQASMGNIREITERLQDSADNLNQITGKIASGEGSIGKLVNDETTVDNLNETLDSIEDGVATLNETMGRYRRYQLQVALRGEALTANDESRMAFGFDLWTTKNRFFRLEGVDIPYGRVKTDAQYVTTTYPDGTTESYLQERIKVSDKIGINAQVGYRAFPNTTVRAGLIESTGGVGVDHRIDLGKRPMILVFEAWDFGREFDQGIHLKFEGRYFISPHIFLTAGWDDPLVSERSSVLFGGGITWNDEDVKYSLGLAGSAFN
jgi:phospholipid/cholesterol/gamma-HCH transport system substrate-binding protein